MTFHSPWAFALLVLVPLVVWWPSRRRHRPAIVFPAAGALASLPRGMRTHFMWVVPILRAVGLSLLIVAIARPQHGIGRMETSTDAIAIQVVIDRSGSMGQEMEFDGKYAQRLDVVKTVFREFALGNEKKGGKLKGRTQDLLGLITFARQAETVCPLVRDPGTLVDLADQIALARQQSEDGTAIGDGLSLAAARLKKAEEEFLARPENSGKSLNIKSKIVILFTDGNNNAGERAPLEAAQLAADWGIKVYTIAIGTKGGFAVQNIFGEKRRIPVRSDVDTRMLTKVAEMTGGQYNSADDADAIRRIYEQIDQLEKTTVETVQYTDYQEKFPPWAIGAGAALLLELLLSSVVLRRSPS